MAYPTDDESMRVLVILQVVGAHLSEVTEITYSENGMEEREVEREQLMELQCVERRGTHDVMVVVASGENLVVTLSVGRRESQSYKRQTDFILQCKGMRRLAEVPSGYSRWSYGERETCLCGIVAVARVVHSSDSAVNYSSETQMELSGQKVAVPMPAILQTVHGGKQRATIATGISLGDDNLMNNFLGNTAERVVTESV